MGSQFGRVLGGSGARMITRVAGRSPTTAARAAEAGFELLPDLEAVVREASLVICIVPSLSALPVAESVAAAMDRAGARPTYMDANSIAPHTARAISEAIEGAGGRYVDGSIIGTADALNRHATVYLSGPLAEEVAETLHPLRTEILGDQPDQASGFKVLYAGLTKGMSALGMELLAGAEALGLRDKLMAKYHSAHPSVANFFESTLPGLPPRAGRRAEEMAELADALDALGYTSHTARAARTVLDNVAAGYRADGGAANEEDLDLAVEWWSRSAASKRQP